MKTVHPFPPLARLAVLACSLPCLLGPRAAVAADLMDSPACHQAMAALLQEEQRLGAAPVPDSTRWQGLRQHAALACLGPAAAGSAPRRGSVTAPISVAPVAGSRTAPAASPSTGASPAARPATPRAITSCDAAGCWTSDGGRVQRMGPELVGPRGVCTVQGAAISCP